MGSVMAHWICMWKTEWDREEDIQWRTKSISVGIRKCGRGCAGVFSEPVFLSATGEPATLKVLGLVSNTIHWKEHINHPFPHAEKRATVIWARHTDWGGNNRSAPGSPHSSPHSAMGYLVLGIYMSLSYSLSVSIFQQDPFFPVWSPGISPSGYNCCF